jgi:hypothetical protein
MRPPGCGCRWTSAPTVLATRSSAPAACGHAGGRDRHGAGHRVPDGGAYSAGRPRHGRRQEGIGQVGTLATDRGGSLASHWRAPGLRRAFSAIGFLLPRGAQRVLVDLAVASDGEAVDDAVRLRALVAGQVPATVLGRAASGAAGRTRAIRNGGRRSDTARSRGSRGRGSRSGGSGNEGVRNASQPAGVGSQACASRRRATRTRADQSPAPSTELPPGPGSRPGTDASNAALRQGRDR